MESGDWRAQLPADSRRRIVNTLTDALKRHVPISGHEGLQNLEKTAVRFEEQIYTAATSQFDYLQKISLKMQTLETRSPNFMPAARRVNSSEGSLDSTARRNNANGGDWQEGVYQKIKAMKDLYLLDLKDFHQKTVGKLQQHDSLGQQPNKEQLEKLKVLKNVLEHLMAFVQIPKHNISPFHKDKLTTYEKQIINVMTLYCWKSPATQQQPLPPPHMHSVQQNATYFKY